MVMSCNIKGNDQAEFNQLYVTANGDSLETGPWVFHSGTYGVSSRGNFNDGFREGIWEYNSGTRLDSVNWRIISLGDLKINLPDFAKLIPENDPTIFLANLNGKDEHCYFTLLRYDLKEINGTVYDYLYQYAEALKTNTAETLVAREFKKYKFKKAEIYRSTVEVNRNRKYQAISYIFVIDDKLYDLTYRDLSEDLDNVRREIFDDILYSFELSNFDLFDFNNKHYSQEENVVIAFPKEI